MTPKRTPISQSEDLDTLSAIWILSCNDDNPIMTYRSIVQRLSLPADFDAKALVKSRPELFRPGILQSRLNAWKDKLRSGKSRPGWIVEIRDQKEQQKAIEDISRDDIFRNQFRVEDDARKCNVELIEWGLRHIERLRKDLAEEKEGKFKRFGTVWIPIGSLLLAALSVGATGISQWKSIESQEKLKFYEVEFKPKQEAYSTFMNELMLSALAANKHSEDEALDHINKMESAFYRFEPFLDEPRRLDIFKKFNAFTSACSNLVKANPPERKEVYVSFVRETAELKGYFRTVLFSALFESKK